MINPRTPVIVGVGQALDHEHSAGEPCEPATLIARALRLAGEDSGAGEQLLRAADSVRCVPAIGWHYRNLPALLAEDLGVHPRETGQSAMIGGEGSQALVNDTARAIAAGELDIALLGGGEAGASLRAAQLAGRTLPWRTQRESMAPPRALAADRPGTNSVEVAMGLAPPVFMYALIEGALQAREGRGTDAHRERIAGLWSRFSQVAAENPHAWIAHAYTPAQIATPSPENRLVAAPYTKLMTANIQVNMASGLILASAAAATRAGVARDRWVFVHAGAQAQEEWHVSERQRLDSGVALGAAAYAALGHVGAGIEEVGHIDLYSCFPAAVEIAARELDLPLDDPRRPLTVTGGLTFAGGPGNNYSSHAIAALVGCLREDPDAYGMVTALGWYLTKHAVGIYSARPPGRPYASLAPDFVRPPARHARGDYAGPATLEAHTIAYRRDGAPEAAILSALTPAGERALVRSEDGELIAWLLAGEPAGRGVELGRDGRVVG
jgi:acetyl-CoA C-acetyltransferase